MTRTQIFGAVGAPTSRPVSFGATVTQAHRRLVALFIERGPTAVAVSASAWGIDAVAVEASAAGRAALCVSTLVSTAVWWQQLGRSHAARVAIAMASILLCFVCIDPWLAVFPALALNVFRLRNTEAWLQRSARSIVLALCLYSIAILFESSGLLWQELSTFSWWLTGIFTTNSESANAHLGLAAAGLYAVVFAICLGVAQILVSRSSATQVLRLMLLLAIGLGISVAFNQRLLPVLLSGVVSALAPLQARALENGSVWRRRLLYPSMVVASLGLVGYSAGLTVSPTAVTHTMGILDVGMRSLTYPAREELGQTINEANFAAFPKVLEASGWSVTNIPEDVHANDLANISVLTVINLNAQLSDPAKQTIEQYVRDGGRLLVLGDHTDIGGIMKPLNTLLAFTDIRFQFDSAIPVDQPTWRWRGCLRGSWHPATFGRTNQELGISVGASLRVRSRAKVLVIGDNAFGDIGNPDYGISRLGNMQYDRGEQRGGLPLVAQQRVGKGVVEVWGDTTGYQTTVLTTTFAGRVNALADLAARRPWPIPRLAWVCGMAVLALVAWVASSSIPLHAAMATSAAAFIATIGVRASAASKTCLIQTGSATIGFDASHVPRNPSIDQKSWIDGWSDLTMRCGHVLLAHESFEAMLESRPFAIVISEPTRPYSESECDQLFDYMTAGGRLFISCGPDGNSRLARLLKRTGLRIEDRTFGATHRSRITHGNTPTEATFASVEPPGPTQAIDAEPAEMFVPYDAEIGFADGHPIAISGDDPAEILVECWDQPMIVRKHLGKGTLLLCGDPRFLTDQVVQHGSDASRSLDQRNAQFLAREFLD